MLKTLLSLDTINTSNTIMEFKNGNKIIKACSLEIEQLINPKISNKINHTFNKENNNVYILLDNSNKKIAAFLTQDNKIISCVGENELSPKFKILLQIRKFIEASNLSINESALHHLGYVKDSSGFVHDIYNLKKDFTASKLHLTRLDMSNLDLSTLSNVKDVVIDSCKLSQTVNLGNIKNIFIQNCTNDIIYFDFSGKHESIIIDNTNIGSSHAYYDLRNTNSTAFMNCEVIDLPIYASDKKPSIILNNVKEISTEDFNKFSDIFLKDFSQENSCVIFKKDSEVKLENLNASGIFDASSAKNVCMINSDISNIDFIFPTNGSLYMNTVDGLNFAKGYCFKKLAIKFSTIKNSSLNTFVKGGEINLKHCVIADKIDLTRWHTVNISSCTLNPSAEIKMIDNNGKTIIVKGHIQNKIDEVTFKRSSFDIKKDKLMSLLGFNKKQRV